MRIDYNLKDKLDFGIFLPALTLFLIGLAAIYSSTQNNPSASGNFERQIIWGIVSLIVFFIVYFVPVNLFKPAALPAYLFSVSLLILVVLVGRQISGSKSWITFGAIGFQPSELAKVSAVFALAAYLSRNNSNIDSFKDILVSISIGLFPVMLILLQPDLGTAIVFIGMVLAIIFWKGISTFSLFIVLSPAFVAIASLFGFYYFLFAMAAILVTLFFFKKDFFYSGSIFALNLACGFFADYVFRVLSPHQQKRILAFIDPSSDPLGSGYNAIQAKVAIGSGGLFGKGFLEGNQTQLQFIPEQWTDFIYCVIGEEFGFIGSVVTILLFLYLFLRILKLTQNTKDEFLSLVAIGTLSIYFIHFIINLGMVVGIMPVIGIPLPFVSYGGSSLLVNMFLLGVLANIYRTRKNYT